MPRDPTTARTYTIELLQRATIESRVRWGKLEGGGFGLNLVLIMGYKVALREVGDFVELRLQRHFAYQTGSGVADVGVISSREFPELFTLWEHVTASMEPQTPSEA